MSVNPTLVGEYLKTQGGIQWDTTERKTEKVCPFTGKRIYQKAVDLGLLPNSATKNVAHGISNLNVAEGAWLHITGCVSDGTNVDNILLCANLTALDVDVTNIDVTTGADLSSYRGLVVLEYTKTV